MQNGAEAVVRLEPKNYGYEPEFNVSNVTNVSNAAKDKTEEMIVKERIQKNYRLPQIDAKIRKERTKTEVRMMTEARRLGILTPVVYGVDDYAIKMERIQGIPLKFAIEGNEQLAVTVGEMVGRLHARDLIHGDLTTSNMIYSDDGKLYLIDFGLSFSDKSVESKGVDIHVLFQTLDSSHINSENLKELFAEGYRKRYGGADEILKRAEEIKLRARYLEGKP